MKVRKVVEQTVVKPAVSPDALLQKHLETAETHLIEAINLFSQVDGVSRRVGYLKRLQSAQESVTTLHREELVRIRGPQRPPKTKKG